MRAITGRIERQGMFIYPMILPTRFQVDALKARGLAYPPPQQVTALIDTGASASVLDPSVIAALGLTLAGQTLIHTPSTGSQYEQRNQYAACISLVPRQMLPTRPACLSCPRAALPWCRSAATSSAATPRPPLS